MYVSRFISACPYLPLTSLLQILKNEQKPAVELCSERELSTYSRFTRTSVGEFMTLFSKTVAERTKPGERQDVEEQCKDNISQEG